MTAQLDMFGTPPAAAEVASTEPAIAGDVVSGGVPPSPFDPRPPYDQAGEWDRMVRVIRATDRLRALHGLTGPELEVVHVAGVARLRAREAPQIWTEL